MASEDDIVEKRRKKAEYMREYNRLKGAVPLKGALVTCARCGVAFERNSGIQKFCSDCQTAARLEAKAARRLSAGHVPVGTSLACRHCGKTCVKTQRRQFYCEACMALNAADKLPALVEWNRNYQREYQKERRRKSPAAAIHCRMSAGIGNSLRDKKAGRSWEALVGYTVEDLMRHLEAKFTDGMTWDNRAEWHIDHIVPRRCFTFETPDDPAFKECWSITNLQPLWKLDNLQKSGKHPFL